MPVFAGGQLALQAGYQEWIQWSTLCYLGVGLGTAHFYSMEIDYKWVLQVRHCLSLAFPLRSYLKTVPFLATLQVRPYAYLPFVAATAAILLT